MADVRVFALVCNCGRDFPQVFTEALEQELVEAGVGPRELAAYIASLVGLGALRCERCTAAGEN